VLVLTTILYASCARIDLAQIFPPGSSAARATPGPGETAPARLTIRLDREGRRISPGLFGSNLQWEHDGDGALVRTSAGAWAWQPGLIERVRESGITSLRFPGGSISNTYRWTAGTGERSKRPPGLTYAKSEDPSTFGTDEYLRLCQEAALQGILTVNVAAGAAEAADWVEYVNGGPETRGGARRVANGIAKPLGVVYWEVGNELYSPNENGHLEAADYGLKVIEFARAMKARDPRIKVGAHLEVSFSQAAWMKGLMPHLLTWNEEVLKVCAKEIDFVVLHFYSPFDTLPAEDDLHRLVWSSSIVFTQNAAMVRGLLKRYGTPGRGVEMAVTEYGTFFGEKIAPGPRIGTVENALFSALLLFACTREPDVTLANHWSLLNNSSFGMLRTRGGLLERRPTFEAIRQLAPLAGGRTIGLDVQCGSFAVKAKGSVPALPEVSVLDGIAVRGKGGDLTVAVVNRSPRGAVDASISFGGGRAPEKLVVRTLAGGEDGTWKAPVESTIAPDGAGSFRYRFAPQSLTLLRAAPPPARPTLKLRRR
jgi:alpha-N-arabinofuranosidase